MRLVTGRILVAAATFLVGSTVLASVAGQRIPGGQLRNDIDVSNAQLDMRSFLIAASEIGESSQKDLELVGKMTGVQAQPKQEGRPLKGTIKSYRAFIRLLARDRIAGNTSYRFGTTQNGLHAAVLNIDFSTGSSCVRREDLVAALGKPARISTDPPSTHAMRTGPSEIWSIAYSFATGSKAIFWFHTQECARSLRLSAGLD